MSYAREPELRWVYLFAGREILVRDYARDVIKNVEIRAYVQMPSFKRSPGRDCVEWISLVEEEAALVVGIETLAAYGPVHTQAQRARLAEWLTEALADGPRRPLGLKQAFHSAGGDTSLDEWRYLEHMAQELGFVQGDLWQLPDDHPWVQLESSDVN